MNRKPCVVLLANLIAALPLLANAQDPRIVQRQAAGAKEPRIEIVRVKRTDSAAPEFQFRLSDGLVDLMRGVSLDSFDGIGDAWTPSFIETFDSRYGRWCSATLGLRQRCHRALAPLRPIEGTGRASGAISMHKHPTPLISQFFWLPGNSGR